jgi:hypothetical protein
MKWRTPELSTLFLVLGTLCLGWWFVGQATGHPADSALLGLGGSLLIAGASERRSSRANGRDRSIDDKGEKGRIEDADPQTPIPEQAKTAPEHRVDFSAGCHSSPFARRSLTYSPW